MLAQVHRKEQCNPMKGQAMELGHQQAGPTGRMSTTPPDTSAVKQKTWVDARAAAIKETRVAIAISNLD